MTSKAASLGLEMNSQKTKVQALGCNHSLGQEVAMVETLSTLAPSYAQQLKALLMSHVTMPLLV